MVRYYRADRFKAVNCIGYLVKRVHHLMHPAVEAAFAAEAISFSQWALLMCLRDGLAKNCGDAAKIMAHDPGSLTRLVDQMQRRGLIARQRSEADRRVVTLALTPAGETMVNALTPHVVKCMNDALDGFTHAEVDTLVSLLGRLVANVSAMSDVASQCKKGQL
jgi:DNA-binding MarR family transcriptional regulator